MALWYTDKGRTFGTRVGAGISRQLQVAEAIVAMTTTMIDNVDDEVSLFIMPKGAVVVRGTIAATDMDTNVSPTLAFDIGDTSVENRLFAAANVGQAGTLSTSLARTGFLYKFTADTVVKAFVQAASATAAAGTLYVAIEYFVDPEYSTTAVTATTTA